ncbi:hypothetical protein MPER_12627 [Moniliophthora perniciosa FA553]|nr:hypothetical protein MPER_12627 [Moniliophthora perniciosa FA553]
MENRDRTWSRLDGWSEWRRARSARRLNIQVEHFVAATGFVDIENDARLSKPGWMGLNITHDLRQTINSLLARGEKLKGLKMVYFNSVETYICDAHGRIIIYRSAITNKMRRDLHPSVIREAELFIAATTAPSPQDHALNLRGDHWFCIIGYDR